MADQSIEQLKTCVKCGKAKPLRSFYSGNDKCRSCRPFPKQSVEHRFWQKVDISIGHGPKQNCWEWKGSRNSHGYGAFGFEGRVTGAHKVAYILTFGPIPEGQCVLHECDNPSCVRPLHLFLGTKKDNFDDMIKKRRQSNEFEKQQRDGKLSAEIVKEMRALYATGQYTMAKLGAMFHVAPTTAQQAIAGRYWKHVK